LLSVEPSFLKAHLLEVFLPKNNTLYFFRAGGSHYIKAFTRAFDLFKGTSGGSSSSRKKVILFLTDGQSNLSAESIIQTIQTKNAELNNEVVIMTYGMKSSLSILLLLIKKDLVILGHLTLR